MFIATAPLTVNRFTVGPVAERCGVVKGDRATARSGPQIYAAGNGGRHLYYQCRPGAAKLERQIAG